MRPPDEPPTPGETPATSMAAPPCGVHLHGLRVAPPAGARPAWRAPLRRWTVERSPSGGDRYHPAAACAVVVDLRRGSSPSGCAVQDVPRGRHLPRRPTAGDAG